MSNQINLSASVNRLKNSNPELFKQTAVASENTWDNLWNECPKQDLQILPNLNSQELKYRIERNLFIEMVSNLTIGFIEAYEVYPLTLDEQQTFFSRSDIKDAMKKIVDSLHDEYIEEVRETGEKAIPIMPDWYREMIYDESEIGKEYEKLAQNKDKAPEELLDAESYPMQCMLYRQYVPIYPKQ